MDDYPVLHSLARYYFDQDYDMRGNTIDEIIAYFRHDTSAGAPQDLASELKMFLQRNSREDDATLTQTFKNTFRPDIAFYQWEGRTTRQTLQRILELVENSKSMT